MQHPNLEEWESKLENALDELDDYLENKYGSLFELHPARAKRGKTSKKSHDGLFSITAGFTLGIGSKYGKGYVVNVNLSTLEHVPTKKRAEIEQVTVIKLQELIPKYLPCKDLQVIRDGKVIKIFGDLSLGYL